MSNDAERDQGKLLLAQQQGNSFGGSFVHVSSSAINTPSTFIILSLKTELNEIHTVSFILTGSAKKD